MATIGLDKLYYAKITEDTSGNETYEDPLPLAKAMTAELSVELAEATLYADDGAAEVVKEFQSGTLTLGVDDIGKSVAEDLTGAVIDENGVLISASEDGGAPVAIGFRAKKANGKYRYVWLFKVRAKPVTESYATKEGTTITRQTGEVEWTAIKRTSDGRYQAIADEGEGGFDSSKAATFLESVYTPTFTPEEDGP